ncbi:hypothetical protein MHBO_001307 [Bonamia ostreae]|uniref:non-specific serine/threonine protein kinase n=1 Tax=Bonamia ostreae TaxID=126728 RepID=A0ABV2AIN0_9EUKA
MIAGIAKHLLKQLLNFFISFLYSTSLLVFNTIRYFQSYLFGNKKTINFKKSNLKITILEQIGEGGYSFVYAAKDQTGRRFAVKKALVQSKEQKTQTDKEITTMKEFDSPYLLKLIDEKKEPHDSYLNFYNHFLLLPFIEQGSLQDILNKRIYSGNLFEEKTIFTIFGKICEGIRTLHDSEPPLAHRDIKLGNVLVDSVYNPFIMDFGSVSEARRQIRSREDAVELSDWASMHCTNAYRPPELLDCPSEIDVDERTDIWSLGCLLYGMAFGQSPFEDSGGTTSVTLAVFSGKIAFPEDNKYSKDFVKMVKWMVNLNAEERPFIKDVIERIKNLLNNHK